MGSRLFWFTILAALVWVGGITYCSVQSVNKLKVQVEERQKIFNKWMKGE
jgi:membrane protein DedA with SNARE-associated domain